MTHPTDLPENPVSIEERVDAIQSLMQERGMEPAAFIDEFKQIVEERWVAENGARVVAKAWTDPAFKQRLLANGKEAVAELGLSMPPHHRHLVVLENTPTIQNVICSHFVHVRRFQSLAFLQTGTRILSTELELFVNQERCCVKWVWTYPIRWKSECGIQPPIPVIWFCHRNLPTVKAGAMKILQRLSAKTP